LNAGEGFESYLWNTGDEVQLLSVTHKEAGTFPYSVIVTDHNSCSSGDTIIITVQKADRIAGTGLDIRLKVYPNPTRGLVYLVFSTDMKKDAGVSVTDMEGRVILEQKLERVDAGVAYTIDLSELQSGMYMLMIDQSPVKIMKTE